MYHRRLTYLVLTRYPKICGLTIAVAAVPLVASLDLARPPVIRSALLFLISGLIFYSIPRPIRREILRRAADDFAAAIRRKSTAYLRSAIRRGPLPVTDCNDLPRLRWTTVLVAVTAGAGFTCWLSGVLYLAAAAGQTFNH